MQQGRGKHQPLLHAVRIGLGQIVDEVGQMKLLDFSGNRLGRPGPVETSHPGDEFEELPPRQLVVEKRLVRNVTDMPRSLARCLDRIVPALLER